MEGEELDNELIVNSDVPETSEELETIETDTSAEVEENQENTVQEAEETVNVEQQIEERANKIAEEKIEARLIRDRVKRERETDKKFAKYQKLESILKIGLNAEDLDDVIAKSSEFYKGQGMIIPSQENKLSLNERDAIILAKADAQDIMKCGKEEMEAEANRIASIPEKDRSIRDRTIFNDICQELVKVNDKENFKSKGYDTKILEDKDFSLFRRQFNLNVPTTDIYEIYSKLNAKTVEKPVSPGSAKSENSNPVETFSAEKINSMKPEELLKYWNNPEFRKVAGLN